MEGIVVKAIGGFFYVDSNNEIYECISRGRVKSLFGRISVGDRVEIMNHNNRWSIEKVFERKNYLVRPSIANVDQNVILFSFKYPDINYYLLDKYIIVSEFYNINVVLCLNKADLVPEAERIKLYKRYKKIGYNVIVTSVKDNLGIEKLRKALINKITVFSGPSGSGKSSILNLINPDFKLRTGELSNKIKRGKHTTRKVELMEVSNNSMVADTPGFSSLDLKKIPYNKLWSLFPEIKENYGNCKYNDCFHIKETNCYIKLLVEKDEIDKGRYSNYLAFFNECKNEERWK